MTEHAPPGGHAEDLSGGRCSVSAAYRAPRTALPRERRNLYPANLNLHREAAPHATTPDVTRLHRAIRDASAKASRHLIIEVASSTHATSYDPFTGVPIERRHEITLYTLGTHPGISGLVSRSGRCFRAVNLRWKLRD